jgi:hypothetical protein
MIMKGPKIRRPLFSKEQYLKKKSSHFIQANTAFQGTTPESAWTNYI